MTRRAGLGLVEVLVATVLLVVLLLPVVGVVHSTTATTTLQDFRLLAHGRASALLEGLLVLDHERLRGAQTPDDRGVDARTHPLTQPLLATSARIAGPRLDLFETLRTQLAFYQESVSIRPVGASGDDGLLRVQVEVRWRTPVDRAAAMHTLVVATLVAQPDLTEVR
ncbi:MAG: hypothetical protein HY815_07820 [Candidatus Riflebacteria bacterium]|nr:hypothetical protein [Candidatus Riflebacteria bacterium]